MDYYGINVKSDVGAESTPDLGSAASPFGDMHGEATSAQWADLAEKYTCKGECDPGTVMCVSKDSEFQAEACDTDLCVSCIGVVSTKPAFKMNSKLEDGKYVGLTGMMPVKIIGAISKKDFIVPTVNGCARAGKPEEIAYKIGVALDSCNDGDEFTLIDCIVK